MTSATFCPRPTWGRTDVLSAARVAEILRGQLSPAAQVPLGMNVHNVELQPGRGGKSPGGAGMSAQLVAKEGLFATLRLPSTEMRRVPIDCRGTLGEGRQRRG